MTKSQKHGKHEKEFVEEPLLAQLEDLGWTVIRASGIGDAGTQYAHDTFRENFSEVILKPKLQEALQTINPFLETDQITEVIEELTKATGNTLLENNQTILAKLLENTSVSENRQTQAKSPTVRYIDFKNLSNNNFYAVSQLKVRILGTDRHFYPDITLFVNGLPLVVIECKSSKSNLPIDSAIKDLLVYSEQRQHGTGGNKELFYYNQILVATCRHDASFGTITSRNKKHYYRWADPYPLSLDDLVKKGDKSLPNDQERLVAGMFAKRNLLDILRSYVLFHSESDKTIKIVGRYQQFRAVKKVIKNLKQGQTPNERSGIIWHTQGSGKSLTMMFLVREMKRDKALKEWKVVFVTDRTNLEKQLAATSKAIGYNVKTAKNIKQLWEYLPTQSSDIIMAMIHKFQEREQVETAIIDDLNTSDRILVMTDEAHRSQYSLLKANLNKALPHATHLGFTGTPIEKTEKEFGEYIDKYTMRQAIEDGVTLEIIYEGRAHKAKVIDKEELKGKFINLFADYTPEELSKVIGRYTKKAYQEAWPTINDKAKDMVKHYSEQVFPNGFKAQIVASSREAAFRYKTAIDKAIVARVNELKKSNPYRIDISLLSELETDVIISSAGKQDESYLVPYTNSTQHESSIARFKLGFDKKGKAGNGKLGILIVNNMLLTGFDAPIEQVMYLDKVVRAQNLLQAIARVNRVGSPHKEKGFVVDYVGVGHHLKKALETYDAKDQQEIIDTLGNPDEEYNKLKQTHEKLVCFFEDKKIDFRDASHDGDDLLIDFFYDEANRFDFILLFKNFKKAFDIVLPKARALEFLNDFKRFVEIKFLIKRFTNDETIDLSDLSKKLRAITEEHLESKGIDFKVPALSILDEKFMEEVKKRKRNKAKAATIEHAIRSYVTQHFDEDPVLYQEFLDVLEKILKDFAVNWDNVFEQLKKLLDKLKAQGQEKTYGLNRKKQMPFFRYYKQILFDTKDLTEDQIGDLVNLTQHTTALLARELSLSGFWESSRINAQSRLKGELQKLLLAKEFYHLPNIFSKRNELISRIMETAKKLNDTILYA